MATIQEQINQSGERKERKHVLMEPSLIRRAEALAAKDEISFGEIVRRALLAYDPEAADDDATLEALAEALIVSQKETIAYLDQLDRKLDNTHARLQKHRHGLEG
ncbi:MAG: hypothetical protein ACR2RB_12810 [Gammaproteobacteria bacterium]